MLFRSYCKEKKRLLAEYRGAAEYLEALTALQQSRETSPPTVYELLQQRIEEAREHSMHALLALEAYLGAHRCYKALPWSPPFYWGDCAVTSVSVVLPPSSPTTSPTLTGISVPERLAPVPLALH